MEANTIENIKRRCMGAAFSPEWENIMALLTFRIEELKTAAIVEQDEKQRLIQKGKYLAFNELFTLQEDLKNIKHIA